ncbi:MULTISPECIES: type VII secretion protein EccE [unclassified Solwaraspora]|uniref:type VII secretion protein EccE n=1 Tax=unclassified Solwaraspora TaxID=2627926 RepID=UPI00259BC8DC|nr:type VII secretion protein EccE [Solwaraspora sp. WMMA2056]WJK41460.1 type VII secretion protein EccE [Solwaraspora sp. WMMA2056]
MTAEPPPGPDPYRGAVSGQPWVPQQRPAATHADPESAAAPTSAPRSAPPPRLGGAGQRTAAAGHVGTAAGQVGAAGQVAGSGQGAAAGAARAGVAPPAPQAAAVGRTRAAGAARVPVFGEAAAGASAAAAPVGRIRPRRIRPGTGPFALGQLVYWQLALTALLAAYQRGPMTALLAAAVLVPLVAPTVVRVRGRWLYQWLAVWLRFRLRSRRLPAGGGNRALDLLRFVADPATVGAVEVAGRTAATISHSGGLCGVLELDPADGSLFVGSALSLPSPATLLPAADPAAPPVAVQLLVQVAAAPRAGRGLVERSYRELTGGDVPAHRRAWLVVQVMRTPDSYTDTVLTPVLVSALRRVQRQLKQERMPARLLGRDDLLTAIGYLAALPGRLDAGNVYGTASDRVTAQETWHAWWSGQVPQVCRRLLRWPELPWQLDDVLRQLPMVDTVVSVAVTREPPHPTQVGDQEVIVSAAVRLTATDPATLAAGDHALTEAVRERGGLTERIDGEHAQGLAATLPLGGFLP